jgi:hypothetical protein
VLNITIEHQNVSNRLQTKTYTNHSERISRTSTIVQ